MSKAKHLGMLCIWMMWISHAKGQSEPVSAKYEGYVYKPAKVEATDERIQSLKIPEGFTIQKFADQLGNPRMLAVTEDGKVYAKGLRNTIGIDWHPTTGEMYGLDHGIDWLGNTEQKEELNIIKADANYGWPYIYADGKKNMADEPKEGYDAFKAKTILPVMLPEAHSAPMDLLFYTGNQFPAEYQQHAFATLHGSWNRETPVGYKVVRIHFENNEPT